MILTSIIIVIIFSIIIENCGYFCPCTTVFVYSLFILLSGTPINIEFLSLSSLPVLPVANDHDVIILRISHSQAKRMRIMELARSRFCCSLTLQKNEPHPPLSQYTVSHDQLSQHCAVVLWAGPRDYLDHSKVKAPAKSTRSELSILSIILSTLWLQIVSKLD